MRTRLAVGLAVVSLSAVPTLTEAQTTATQAGRSRDAAAIDPAHHQVVFENDHVRVIRGMVSPGDRSPMHTHPPTLLVSLGTSRLRMTDPKGANSFFDLTPGQVLWLGDGGEHSWQMLAGQLHIIGIEVKAAARGTPPAAVTLPATDAVKVDPVVHQVLVDNPYVRVLEGLAGAGRKSPLHSHSHSLALVSLGRVRLNLTGPDGNGSLVDLHPGQVIWIDAGSHSWEIISGVHNVIAVEVKSAAAR